MNNWRKTTLGDVCEYESQKTSDLDINTYISTENMLPNKGGVVLASNLPNKGTFTKYSNGQTLVSNIRPYFKKIWRADKNGACSNDVLCFKLKDKIIDSFFYYFLNQDTFFEFVMNGAKGTKMPRGDRKHILQFEINLPPLDEQKRIADVLSALDDKIEINNKINENLEAQAQAIFKQWFVDFEFPDAEGKPYKTNGGKFIDSELGEIPLGWKVGKIRDIVLSTIGGDWGKEQKIDNYISEVYCIRGADINDIIKGNKGKMPTRFILEKNYNSKKLEANDIVIEISGGSPTQSTGRVALITDALLNRYDKSMICTNFCRAIKPLENYSYFIFYYWRYLYDLNTMFSYENGTTGIKNLDINGVLDNENVVLPNIELLNCFNNYVLNIMKTIFNNGLESENLSEIRDSLLPKLMSGEVRV